nr:hypothetical protein [Streptococcus suis]
MIEVKTFGEKAKLYFLENKNGMQVTLTDFGARVVGVFLPVEEGGNLRNVSLGAGAAEEYLQTDPIPGQRLSLWQDGFRMLRWKLVDTFIH